MVTGFSAKVVGIEHRIEHVAGLEFMDAVQHRDPVRAVTGEMDKALRSGDFRHRHGRLKRVAAGLAAGDFELVSAEADAIRPVAQGRIEPGGRGLDSAEILHAAVLLLDLDDVERRIGEHLRHPQGVRASIDFWGLAGLQNLAFPHAEGVAAEQQGFRRLRRRIDEDRA
jgi:hypothetical protein